MMRLHTLAAGLLSLTASAAWCAPSGKLFSSPEQAARALAEAARADGSKDLLEVLGPESKRIVNSGDAVADGAAKERFLAAFDAKHAIETKSEEVAVLTVGEDQAPFPVPIVKVGSAWAFDPVAGEEEVLARRIGINELDAIESLYAYVEAQELYALSGIAGHGGEYAQRIVSAKGKKDGLFWPADAGGGESPLGPLIGGARRDGYAMDSGKPAPYRGYRFRILKRQGEHAVGGARRFIVDGRMIGGFAMIATPAKYGASGVMTFIVSHEGKVFQKDLGTDTASAAAAIKAYDPDPSWSQVEGR